MNCVTSLKIVEGCLATYQVLEDVLVGDRRKEIVKKVVFNRENHDLSCECSLFEFRGILCRHALCVFAHERIENVKEQYILSRWKKNIKRKHSYIKSSYSAVQLKPQIERFDKLCKHFYNVAEVAAESEVATKALHETLHDFDSNLPTMDDTTGNGKESFNEDSNPNTGTKIRSPVHVNRKGRPQKNRKISVLETVCKKPRKKTRTSYNGETATECNVGMISSQTESSIRVESSIEVVTGDSLMDSNTVVRVHYKIMLTNNI
ncbi:hypothetical protein TSUD_96600 [Trifolium subterraneum]|nr:hypothetical protein TSUD_96600 [Trifolium subterraneum]